MWMPERRSRPGGRRLVRNTKRILAILSWLVTVSILVWLGNKTAGGSVDASPPSAEARPERSGW